MALGALVGAWQLRSARADLLIARSQLQSVARDLGQAQTAEGRALLRASTTDAVRRTERARSRLRGSLPLQMVGALPGLSAQRSGIIGAADVAARASAVAADLAAVADQNVEAITLRNGSIDVTALARFADEAGGAARRIAALPKAHRGGQWGVLARNTRHLDDVVDDAGRRLATGAGTLRATADLLGAAGPRRYFLALQNNAEMRDQGMVLSFAVAEANDGRLRIVRSGRTTELELRQPVTDIALGPGTRQVFQALAPLQFWQSVNAWADTELSGRAMMSMYRAATGERVDGVITLDVPALAGLLGVTGPVNVDGIAEPISADNAGRILLNDLYVADRSKAQSERRERLAEVAAAVTAKLQTSTVDAAGLAQALGTAAAGRHLSITSAHASEQRAFVAAGLGGGPAAHHPERTIHLAVENGTATKLDYFVKPRIAFDVSVTPDDSAVVRATVTIPNTAPVPTPDTFQFADQIVQFTPGLYKARVYFWGPRGSEQLDSVEDSGLNLSWSATDVAAGTSATATFTTVVANAVRGGELRLRFVPQPRLTPAQIRVSVAGMGRRVLSKPQIPARWDRSLDLRWMVSEPR